MEPAKKRTKIHLVPRRDEHEEPARKRTKISTKRSPVAVVFIGCGGDGQHFTTNARRPHLLRAVRNASDAGATIINISFGRIVSGTLGDPDTLLPELRSQLDDTWGSSVGQPAYSIHSVGSMIASRTHVVLSAVWTRLMSRTWRLSY